MSAKTKIVVLKMKELIYTAIFASHGETRNSPGPQDPSAPAAIRPASIRPPWP